MEILPYAHIDKKGLGTNDLFQAIPVGKAGTFTEITVTDGGTVRFDRYSKIDDSEMKVATVLLSHTFHQIGKEILDTIRDGEMLPTISETTGQAEYQKAISVDAKDFAEMIYVNDDTARKKGRKVFKHLQNLEDMAIRYRLPYLDTTIRLFDRVAYKNGVITFDIANSLINRMATTMLSFRLSPVLEHNGLAMRLAMIVETNQRFAGTYKDSSGEKRNKYYPLNEYYLDDLLFALQMESRREDKAIKEIQRAFNVLHREGTNPIAKYTYNKHRRSFESEYKNGKKCRSRKVPNADKRVPTVDKKVPSADIYPMQHPSTA